MSGHPALSLIQLGTPITNPYHYLRRVVLYRFLIFGNEDLQRGKLRPHFTQPLFEL